MKIQKIMEVSDSFVRAYDYYKRELKKSDGTKSPDLILSTVARMFGLNNLKKFKIYAMRREGEEERGIVRPNYW